jgi:acyl CoA:acetate/3-ketoacid CoA transferase
LFEVGAHLELGPSGLVVSKPGKSAKFVEQVEHITFSGPRGLRSGQEVIFVTERCTMRMTPSGVTATNIMPGIDPQRDIVDASRGVVSLASNAALLPVSILQQGKFGLEL